MKTRKPALQYLPDDIKILPQSEGDYSKSYESKGEEVAGSCEVNGLYIKRNQEDQMGVFLADEVSKDFMALSDATKEKIQKQTFYDLEKGVKQKTNSQSQGSCAVIATGYIKEGVALTNVNWLGDSAAFCVHVPEVPSDDNPVTCTLLTPEFHNFSNSSEVKRVKEEKGFFFKKRLGGRLAITRSFGDNQLDGNGISHVPEVHHSTQKIAGVGRTYMVVMCDGAYDCWGSKPDQLEMYAQRVLRPIFEVKEQSPTKLAENIVDCALRASSQDNISVSVVLLGSEASTAYVLDGHGGPDVSKFLSDNYYEVFKANVKSAMTYQFHAEILENASQASFECLDESINILKQYKDFSLDDQESAREGFVKCYSTLQMSMVEHFNAQPLPKELNLKINYLNLLSEFLNCSDQANFESLKSKRDRELLETTNKLLKEKPFSFLDSLNLLKNCCFQTYLPNDESNLADAYFALKKLTKSEIEKFITDLKKTTIYINEKNDIKQLYFQLNQHADFIDPASIELLNLEISKIELSNECEKFSQSKTVNPHSLKIYERCKKLGLNVKSSPYFQSFNRAEKRIIYDFEQDITAYRALWDVATIARFKSRWDSLQLNYPNETLAQRMKGLVKQYLEKKNVDLVELEKIRNLCAEYPYLIEEINLEYRRNEFYEAHKNKVFAEAKAFLDTLTECEALRFVFSNKTIYREFYDGLGLNIKIPLQLPSGEISDSSYLMLRSDGVGICAITESKDVQAAPVVAEDFSEFKDLDQPNLQNIMKTTLLCLNVNQCENKNNLMISSCQINTNHPTESDVKLQCEGPPNTKFLLIWDGGNDCKVHPFDKELTKPLKDGFKAFVVLMNFQNQKEMSKIVNKNLHLIPSQLHQLAKKIVNKNRPTDPSQPFIAVIVPVSKDLKPTSAAIFDGPDAPNLSQNYYAEFKRIAELTRPNHLTAKLQKIDELLARSPLNFEDIKDFLKNNKWLEHSKTLFVDSDRQGQCKEMYTKINLILKLESVYKDPLESPIDFNKIKNLLKAYEKFKDKSCEGDQGHEVYKKLKLVSSIELKKNVKLLSINALVGLGIALPTGIKFGALLGGIIGTVIAPGVGTVAGSIIGGVAAGCIIGLGGFLTGYFVARLMKPKFENKAQQVVGEWQAQNKLPAPKQLPIGLSNNLIAQTIPPAAGPSSFQGRGKVGEAERTHHPEARSPMVDTPQESLSGSNITFQIHP